jgi:hypothetical protein
MEKGYQGEQTRETLSKTSHESMKHPATLARIAQVSYRIENGKLVFTAESATGISLHRKGPKACHLWIFVDSEPLVLKGLGFAC